ncbi:GntR family transcriptional regulator [Prolixibacteraceae bacterium JC049]|nr:GntR family transcriptional regulator [Prolixibacteraceae bacterium JC049]
MSNSSFTFSINSESDQPKFRQIIDAVIDAIAEKRLNQGDRLPSVNYVCQTYKLSRDTVFKAYAILKEQGIIQSVPNKGYFVSNETRKVFVFLDTFKAYKEVLYHSFIDNLDKNIIADVHFHHYNIELFSKLLNESFGKYSKYIIMPFDHPEMANQLKKIANDKLLIIDWELFSNKDNNILYQDFNLAFQNSLKAALPEFSKYKKVVFVYPEFTYHPQESVDAFQKFCQKNDLNHSVMTHSSDFKLEPKTAYISVSDRILGRFLEMCNQNNLEPGKDVGFLSYNETPMKKFIYKGISVISTDFGLMGKRAADFASSDQQIREEVPTSYIKRASL